MKKHVFFWFSYIHLLHICLGLDLYSAEEKTIPAKGKELVPTKLAITVPVGSYGRIAPRYVIWFQCYKSSKTACNQ